MVGLGAPRQRQTAARRNLAKRYPVTPARRLRTRPTAIASPNSPAEAAPRLHHRYRPFIQTIENTTNSSIAPAPCHVGQRQPIIVSFWRWQRRRRPVRPLASATVTVVSERAARQPRKRRNTSDALVPPNPNEFDSTTSMLRDFAFSGTRSITVSTDGFSRLRVGGATLSRMAR